MSTIAVAEGAKFEMLRCCLSSVQWLFSTFKHFRHKIKNTSAFGSEKILRSEIVHTHVLLNSSEVKV